MSFNLHFYLIISSMDSLMQKVYYKNNMEKSCILQKYLLNLFHVYLDMHPPLNACTVTNI